MYKRQYLHRIGRTARAGNTGVAVTFVDWDDLHKWALINRALEFGQPEPTETYSSSPHLFHDLDIPAGTKGRLKPASAVAAPTRSATAGRHESRNEASPDRPPRNRSRNRTRGGRPAGDESSASVAPEAAKADVAADVAVKEPGTGTHDGKGHEHHDGNAAPARRRRRRGPRTAGGAAPAA